MAGKQKFLIIISAVVILALIVLGVMYFFQNVDKVSLTVKALPEDSILTVDDIATKPGNITVQKGKHTLKAKRQYFTDAVQEIDTSNINTAETIFLLPAPDSQEAINWLNSNPEVQKQREAAGASQAAATSENMKDKYPFLDQLPRRTLGYSINYSLDANLNISFQITIFPRARAKQDGTYDTEVAQYKAQAIDFLKQIGVDTDKAKITYTVNTNSDN